MATWMLKIEPTHSAISIDTKSWAFTTVMPTAVILFSLGMGRPMPSHARVVKGLI
jgi:hypothetical protein